MQSPRMRDQRGSTNWAFIITLLLLLVFVWLWYGETDKQDKNAKEIKDLQASNSALNVEGAKVADLLKELSDAVGWEGKNVQLDHITRPERSFAITDVALVRANFKPDGVVQAAEGQTSDGILKRILAASQLTYEREARPGTAKTGTETPHTFKTLSNAFKEKLASVRAKWDGVAFDRPAPPADPDDEQGKADYASALQAWEAKVKEYDDDLKALSEMEGWKEYNERIAAPGQWGDITKEGVTVHFYTYGAGGDTIEAAMVGLDEAFKRMGAELRSNMEALGSQVVQLRKETAAKEEALTTANAALTTEQEARTNDVNQLTTRVNAETERANRNAIEKTTAQNEMQKSKEAAAKEITGLKRDVEARKEQNRLLKEKQDLVIARNDKDGSVLMANGTLGTAVIDLGNADKVYVGQKFGVSDLDRMGNRRMKGEIMVVRVTGAHSASCRILAGTVGGGDNIHNPFYQAGETIYVYFAAKLDKWPKNMATQRLAKMGVVVQDAPDGHTQYIVVPNSWAAPKKAATDEDEGDGEAAANPLEEIMKTARLVGANVITENILDAFLDY